MTKPCTTAFVLFANNKDKPCNSHKSETAADEQVTFISTRLPEMMLIVNFELGWLFRRRGDREGRSSQLGSGKYLSMWFRSLEGDQRAMAFTGALSPIT